jgi:hypothetical protein
VLRAGVSDHGFYLGDTTLEKLALEDSKENGQG